MTPSGLRAPAAPDYKLEWSRLDETYDWVSGLKGCPQDPIHHAEGDVWIHTRMVLDALLAMPAWRALDVEGRDIVYLAALLHDVAKPITTRVEGARVTARGHSTKGALMAREILWRLGVPFATREAVCGLIRYHQVPYFLIDEADVQRRLCTISQAARCDLLALVAEADMRGRVCADQERVLLNVALFAEAAAAEGCASAPRPFPSGLARFWYFRKPERSPDYDPHDDSRCTVTVMCGLPGAGKDTWLKENAPHLPVISLDALRETLDVDPRDPQGPVIEAAREAARVRLRRGEDFAWNATNLSKDIRHRIIDLCADYNARVRLVYVEVPEPTLRARNRARPAAVPDRVIDGLLRRWELPDATEAAELVLAVHGADQGA